MEDSCACARDPDSLEIVDHSRLRFVRFNLGTHLLQARSQRINLVLLRVNLATVLLGTH